MARILRAMARLLLHAHGRFAARAIHHPLARSQPLRFSLDESFDIGQDTGTPVIDEYDAKMPFKFSGSLKRVEVEVGTDGLTPGQRGELELLKRDFALRVQ
jgi:arylsulfatase